MDIEQAFIKVIDELVVEAEEGSDLAEGIKYIDTQAHKNGIAFHEMALIILRKHLAERKAKTWLQSKHQS